MPHTEREVLLSKLDQARTQVEVGAEYVHTKSGGRYVVISVAIGEDDEEVKVIYRELSHEPPIDWVRSFDGKDGWIVPTEIDGKPAPRFTKISS